MWQTPQPTQIEPLAIHICVLGILASHHKGLCIPVKLYTDLKSDSTKFIEEEPMSMVKGFVALVYSIIYCN